MTSVGGIDEVDSAHGEISPKTEYRASMDALIRDTLDELQCQPILFVGSGFSRRYGNAPDWMGLLRLIADNIGMSGDEFSYLQQKLNHSAIDIGTALTERVFEYAWSEGKEEFDAELFEESSDKSLFIKAMAAGLLENSLLPIAKLPKALGAEVHSLAKVKPHAIITTNYDTILERIFPDYEQVVGQRIIRSNLNYFGEIFKIHGSTNEYKTIIINGNDYEDYNKKESTCRQSF